MYPGYKLSFEQIRTCLSDCSALSGLQSIGFTGREPTLWTDGNLDFVALEASEYRFGKSKEFPSNIPLKS